MFKALQSFFPTTSAPGQQLKAMQSRTKWILTGLGIINLAVWVAAYHIYKKIEHLTWAAFGENVRMLIHALLDLVVGVYRGTVTLTEAVNPGYFIVAYAMILLGMCVAQARSICVLHDFYLRKQVDSTYIPPHEEISAAIMVFDKWRFSCLFGGVSLLVMALIGTIQWDITYVPYVFVQLGLFLFEDVCRFRSVSYVFTPKDTRSFSRNGGAMYKELPSDIRGLLSAGLYDARLSPLHLMMTLAYHSLPWRHFEKVAEELKPLLLSAKFEMEERKRNDTL